jgi:hypothetical protein
MTSKRRLEANRKNAQASTGPKTAEGKARVAQNAVVHGLLSQQTLLPDEDPEALETLAETMRAELNPEGPQEEFLVEMMVRALWRLRRLGRVEAGIFAWKHYSILVERASHEAARYERTVVPALTDHYDPTAITDPQKHQQARAAAEHLSDLRNGATPTMGLTFIRGSSGVDAFSKLSRYETAIERSYYRAFHELQRLQHARLGGHVPPPLAVDVMVSRPDDGGPDSPGRTPRPSRRAEPAGAAAEDERHGQAEQTTERSIEDELFG